MVRATSRIVSNRRRTVFTAPFAWRSLSANDDPGGAGSRLIAAVQASLSRKPGTAVGFREAWKPLRARHRHEQPHGLLQLGAHRMHLQLQLRGAVRCGP